MKTIRPLRIGLFGFGQTGKLAARETLLDSECELSWVVRRQWNDAEGPVSSIFDLPGKRGEKFTLADAAAPDFFRKHKVDCIVDFSGKSGVDAYAHAAKAGICVVSAVSHYDEENLAKLKEMSRTAPVLWSPNITLGINFIMAMGKIFRNIAPAADVQIVEEHFAGKKGVSGTALRMASTLGVDPEESVRSIRAGGIVGRHQIIFGMPNQTLRFTHESVSRAVFGRGALLAAKWMRKRPPGYYTMEQVMTDLILSAAHAEE